MEIPFNPETPRGVFISFEGPEGSGKSTQIAMLTKHLQGLGKKIIGTREPGGTPAGNRIRQIFLDPECKGLEPQTELFLMLAQRSEHLKKTILPAVMDGVNVICDRYYDSSMAYQGFGRGLPPTWIHSLHSETLGDFLPDVTILLDLPPAKGLERAIRFGRKKPDRMEAEELAFHEKVRKGYLEIAQNNPRRYIVLNGEGTPESIFEEITRNLGQRFSWLF